MMKDIIRLAMVAALIVFGLMAASVVVVEVYDWVKRRR